MGQPSIDLSPAGTSARHGRMLTAGHKNPRATPVHVSCAPQGSQHNQTKSRQCSSPTGRAMKLCSQTTAAPRRVVTDLPVKAKEQEPSAAPMQPGISSRIQSWMPWSQSIPLASQIGSEFTGKHSHDEAAMVGDGMASTPPPAPQPPSRRGWYIMSRRRGSSSDDVPTPAPAMEQRPVQVDHETIQVLRQRVISKSSPCARQDSFKLGLVVEGGGMRGCVSGGALQALNDLGIRDAFDAVYGSSAGAINSTFFLSGQRDGVHIYHDHIASEEFIDLRRLISRRPGTAPALNLDFLLGEVINDACPLDFDAVLSSQIPLKVVASSLDSLSPVLLQDFKCKDDLIACLRASATVPEVAGGPVHHRGQRFVDAAVFEAVPFRSAIADGCTHVLVLCTRPAPARRSYLDQALSDAVEGVIKRAVMSPDYMVPAWQAEVESLVKDGMSQDEMLLRSLDEDAHEFPWFAGTHVYPVYPSASAASFSPLCIHVPTLKSGVAEGRRAVMAIARAALADAIDLSRFEEVANIMPILQMKRGVRKGASAVPASASSSGRDKRYAPSKDFSHHA